MPYIPDRKEKIEKAASELGVELDYESEIKPGDLYLACRNGPAQLLTCQVVSPKGYIQAVELAYSFDTGECVKVKS